MQNWDIIETCNLFTVKNENSNNNCLLDELIEENKYDSQYDPQLKKGNIQKQLENINLLIKEINSERLELINSFPSCSLAIIRNLSQNEERDEDQMEIDQMSFSNSEIINSNNNSPIYESRTNADQHQILTDSPESMNISDFI